MKITRELDGTEEPEKIRDRIQAIVDSDEYAEAYAEAPQPRLRIVWLVLAFVLALVLAGPAEARNDTIPTVKGRRALERAAAIAQIPEPALWHSQLAAILALSLARRTASRANA